MCVEYCVSPTGEMSVDSDTSSQQPCQVVCVFLTRHTSTVWFEQSHLFTCLPVGHIPTYQLWSSHNHTTLIPTALCRIKCVPVTQVLVDTWIITAKTVYKLYMFLKTWNGLQKPISTHPQWGFPSKWQVDRSLHKTMLIPTITMPGTTTIQPHSHQTQYIHTSFILTYQVMSATN